MSTTNSLTAKQKAVVVIGVLALTAVLVGGWLFLRAYGPGNMGNGFLQGGLVALAAFAITAWRVTRVPERTRTFERAWTRTGDERDDAVLTRALAELGILSIPMTGVAAVAIAVGVHTPMVLALLLFAEIAVLAVAFVVINRNS